MEPQAAPPPNSTPIPPTIARTKQRLVDHEVASSSNVGSNDAVPVEPTSTAPDKIINNGGSSNKVSSSPRVVPMTTPVSVYQPMSTSSIPQMVLPMLRSSAAPAAAGGPSMMLIPPVIPMVAAPAAVAASTATSAATVATNPAAGGVATVAGNSAAGFNPAAFAAAAMGFGQMGAVPVMSPQQAQHAFIAMQQMQLQAFAAAAAAANNNNNGNHNQMPPNAQMAAAAMMGMPMMYSPFQQQHASGDAQQAAAMMVWYISLVHLLALYLINLIY
jgi:hypothetical protein